RRKMSWHPGHIELADNADLVLIAPATADILAKLAHGFADDALTSIVLATEAPLLLARDERKDVDAPRRACSLATTKESGVSGRSTKSSPKRLNTRSADAQHARQRKKNRRRDQSPPIPAND